MVAELVDYVVGVGTHRDGHTLALVEARSGAVVAQRRVASNGRGYAQALRFAQQHAEAGRLWAVEGAGHYGAGLARYLSERGETVLEVSRSPRSERLRRSISQPAPISRLPPDSAVGRAPQSPLMPLRPAPAATPPAWTASIDRAAVTPQREQHSIHHLVAGAIRAPTIRPHAPRPGRKTVQPDT